MCIHYFLFEMLQFNAVKKRNSTRSYSLLIVLKQSDTTTLVFYKRKICFYFSYICGGMGLGCVLFVYVNGHLLLAGIAFRRYSVIETDPCGERG